MKHLQTWVVYSTDPYAPEKLNRIHRYEEYADEEIPVGIIESQFAARKKSWETSMKEGNYSAFKMQCFILDSESFTFSPVTEMYVKMNPIKQKKVLNESGQAEKKFIPTKKWSTLPTFFDWDAPLTPPPPTSVTATTAVPATTNNPDWL